MCSAVRDNVNSGVVARISSLLGVFTPTDRELSGAELARRSGLARSTAHRLVSELVAEGLLERTDSGRYQLGMRLFELGQMAPRQRGLRESAAPFMCDLRDATRQTVHLAVLDGAEVVYLDIIRAASAPRMQSRVGGRLPAHATGVGKAILAFSDSSVVEEIIAAGLTRLTRYTIDDPNRLRRELAQTAQRGSAYDREENALGTICCASPVFGPDNAVIGAISVAGHTTRFDVERVAAAVRSTAMAISRMQGSLGKARL